MLQVYESATPFGQLYVDGGSTSSTLIALGAWSTAPTNIKWMAVLPNDGVSVGITFDGTAASLTTALVPESGIILPTDNSNIAKWRIYATGYITLIWGG